MTRREEIIKILSNQEISLPQLANYFKTELKDILEDIPHIEKSISPRKLIVTPAKCKKCNFIFKEKRLKKPSKCPRCHEERIIPPTYRIE
ncbi:MAG: transcriptional regulator [Candidatus Woesearchaeota archaeon]